MVHRVYEDALKQHKTYPGPVKAKINEKVDPILHISHKASFLA